MARRRRGPRNRGVLPGAARPDRPARGGRGPAGRDRTFFALAAYLTAESIHDLISRARPGESIPGLAVSAAALIVMPALAVAKRRTGQALGNRTLIADSAETAFCAWTSAATLAGVALNATLGWWWADPIAALVIAALAVKEGLETWHDDD